MKKKSIFKLGLSCFLKVFLRVSSKPSKLLAKQRDYVCGSDPEQLANVMTDFCFSNLLQLINERKTARGDAPIGGKKGLSRSKTSAADSYGDAMAEMMKRIKDGTVGLRKANRRLSEQATPSENQLMENLEKVKLKNTNKYATIGDRRTSSSAESSVNGDLFDTFRTGLKPSNQKSHTLGGRGRSTNVTVDFREALKSVPQAESPKTTETAVDEMKKLNVSTSMRYPLFDITRIVSLLYRIFMWP